MFCQCHLLSVQAHTIFGTHTHHLITTNAKCLVVIKTSNNVCFADFPEQLFTWHSIHPTLSVRAVIKYYTVSQKKLPPTCLLNICSKFEFIICAFQKCKHFENPLRFDKVTESFRVGTFFETQCINRPILLLICLQRQLQCSPFQFPFRWWRESRVSVHSCWCTEWHGQPQCGCSAPAGRPAHHAGTGSDDDQPLTTATNVQFT